MDEVLIDTNIVVYGYQPEERFKHPRAVDVVETLMENGRGRLSAQILAEFVNATTKERRPILPIDEVQTQVEWLVDSFTVYDLTPFIIFEALRGVRQHRLSYFDAQIWATAKLNQVPTILTEDFQNGRLLEGVLFVNPFHADFDLEEWR
jgi:predicted nucleic acid-binding protein